MAEGFAKQHAALADAVHGTALIEVPRAEAPEAIPSGDKRQATSGVTLVCHFVERGMVEYSYTRTSGQTFRSRMATRSWRVLPKVGA